MAQVGPRVRRRGRREQEWQAAAGNPGAHGVFGKRRLGTAEDESVEPLSGRRATSLLQNEPAELVIGGVQCGRDAEREVSELAAAEGLLLDFLQVFEERVGGAELHVERDVGLATLPRGLPEVVVDATGGVSSRPDEGHEGRKDTTLTWKRRASTIGSRFRSS